MRFVTPQFALLCCLFGLFGLSSCCGLPVIGPVLNGTDAVGDQYMVFAVNIAMKIGMNGLWLVPIQGCRVGPNHWRFVTRYEHFTKQVGFELHGEFTKPEQDAFLWQVDLEDPGAYAELVAVDNLLVATVNQEIFDNPARMSPYTRSLFGPALPLTADSQPELTADTMSFGSFFAKYHGLSRNVPSRTMLLLQGISACNNDAVPGCFQELVPGVTLQTAIMNLLIILKGGNEFNLYMQCLYVKCPEVPRLPPAKTAWIDDSYECLAV